MPKGPGVPAAPEAVPLPLDGIDTVQFDANGLVPAVVQDWHTGDVLMLGFMNRATLARTLETGNVWFWSRRRNQAWLKGETSGNFLRVREVRKNCYQDSLLVLAEPVGPVCHTGEQVCYYRKLDGTPVEPGAHPGAVARRGARHDDDTLEHRPDSPSRSGERVDQGPASPAGPSGSMDWLFEIIDRRRRERPAGSYVVQLLDQGVDRIARKLGEETAEVIIAAKNRSAADLAAEMADLWFFSLVLLADAGLTPRDVYRVLAGRHRPRGARRAGPAGEAADTPTATRSAESTRPDTSG